MSATVLIKRVAGAAGETLPNARTDAPRQTTADVPADGTANPTAIPASSNNYSFWACIRLVCSVAPATQINNIRFYGPASNTLGTGVDCNVSTVAGTNGSMS